MDRAAKIKYISMHHGYDAQSRQCMEEMGELTQALNKFWRVQLEEGKKSINDIPFLTPEEIAIYEEIADVEICLEHLKAFLECGETVERKKDEKLDREIKRINKRRKGTC